jgi:hypothetical protein
MADLERNGQDLPVSSQPEPVIFRNAEQRAAMYLAGYPEPGIIIGPTAMGDEEIEAFAVAWRAAYAGTPRHKGVVLLTPMPRRVRLRLAVTREIDRAAIWAITRVHWRAGVWVWRLTGHWKPDRR